MSKAEISTLQIVIGLVILITVALLLITITSKQVTEQVGGVETQSITAISKIGDIIESVDTGGPKSNIPSDIPKEGEDIENEPVTSLKLKKVS